MFNHVRKDLIDRVKPGTPHHEAVRKAMEACFAIADDAVALRSDIRLDGTISAAERKRQLEALAEGSLAHRLDRAWEPFASIKASLDAAKKQRQHTGYVPPAEVAAADNISLVEVAMYFARRDIDGR